MRVKVAEKQKINEGPPKMINGIRFLNLKKLN